MLKLVVLLLSPVLAAPAQVAVHQIQVIEGEGTVHTPGARNSRPLTVQITGETGEPVSGAAVSFHLPDEGPVLGTGAIQTNAAADFTKYFAGSETGGAFLLRAVFPVAGDVSQIAPCDVAMANSAGSTKAPRVTF